MPPVARLISPSTSFIFSTVPIFSLAFIVALRADIDRKWYRNAEGASEKTKTPKKGYTMFCWRFVG